MSETASQSDARFRALLEKMWDLHGRKRADYGKDADHLANLRASEDFGIPAWIGAAVRMNDKMRRIQAFARKRELKNESITDSLLDLSVYALLTLILFEEETFKGG